MNSSIKSLVMTAALAAATLGAVGTANAREYAPVGPWQPERGYVYSDRGDRYNHYDRYDRYDRDGWRDVCRAPRWDPRTRYMPGDTVRRKGDVYRATRLSARVWNVNSPPEWTPNYWVQVRC